MGAVHVRLDDEGLTISNPGGLVDGVTLANLLVTEPRPRSRALADAMKRIGVVERSGRGVDTIYRGMLRYGRREPDYRRTDAQNVVLRLATEDADQMFLRLVVEEEGRRSKALPIDALIVLAALNGAKQLSVEELAAHVQRDLVQTKRTLEALGESGLVQAHGATPRTRSFTLAQALYGTARSQRAAYTRQAGLTELQHEQMVLSFVNHMGASSAPTWWNSAG